MASFNVLLQSPVCTSTAGSISVEFLPAVPALLELSSSPVAGDHSSGYIGVGGSKRALFVSERILPAAPGL